ncbi:MAG: hypothetical protein WBA29_05375, partial [Xanthobacteraceae bacterium]
AITGAPAIACGSAVVTAAGRLANRYPSFVAWFRVFLDRHGGLAYLPRRDTSPQREAYYLEG